MIPVMPKKLSAAAANIVAGVKASLSIEPEYTDVAGLHARFGIKRGLAYALLDEGVIEAVSLRRRGQARGKRLFSIKSVRKFIDQQIAQQKAAK